MMGLAESRGVPRYEQIGRGYARTRHEDRRLAQRIHMALGEARTTVKPWLGGRTQVEAVEIPPDTPGWTLGSFWAHPERLLDANAPAEFV